MEPYVVSLTNVSDWVDGIKGSVDGCSSCAIDKERQMPFAFVPNDKFLQLFGDHSTSVILDLTFSYFFRNFKFWYYFDTYFHLPLIPFKFSLPRIVWISLKCLTQYVPDLIVQRGAIRIFRLHHVERLKTFLCHVLWVCIKPSFQNKQCWEKPPD